MRKIHFFRNVKNITFYLDKIDLKDNNIIYVTGLSGSGKTTYAKELSKKYQATLFELDNLSGYFWTYKDSKELIHQLTGEFLEMHPKLKDIIKKDKFTKLKIEHFDEFTKWTNQYISFLEDYAKAQNQLFIFEGTQIFKCMGPKQVYEKPIIIMGTCSFLALVRRMQRQYKIDQMKNRPHFFRKHFWKLLNDSKRLHWKDYKILNEFLKSIQS